LSEPESPCLPHQAGQADVTSIGGAVTHHLRGAARVVGTPTGGVASLDPRL